MVGIQFSYILEGEFRPFQNVFLLVDDVYWNRLLWITQKNNTLSPLGHDFIFYELGLAQPVAPLDLDAEWTPVFLSENRTFVGAVLLSWKDLQPLNLPKSLLQTHPLISTLFEAIFIELYWPSIFQFILSISAVVPMIFLLVDEISQPRCFYLDLMDNYLKRLE